jgi:hypothetical protein
MKESSDQVDLYASLSAELVQSIFPIARSDRRKNRDLFADVISEDRLRNDQAFYDVLVQVIASGDYARLRDYDERMSRSGEKTKSFGFRALRWLVSRSPAELTQHEIFDLSPDHFPLGTPDWIVHQLFLGLIGQSRSGPSPSSGVDSPADEATSLDWVVLARDLADGAQSLKSPDIEAAQRLISIAERLADACRAAAEAARAQINTRTNAIRGRLNTLNPDLANDWLEDATSDDLDSIEVSLVLTEKAQEAYEEAQRAFETAIAAADVARASKELRRWHELSAQVVQADEHLQSTRTILDEAIKALAAHLRAERPRDAVSQIAPQPSPHQSEPDLKPAADGREVEVDSEPSLHTAPSAGDIPKNEVFTVSAAEHLEPLTPAPAVDKETEVTPPIASGPPHTPVAETAPSPTIKLGAHQGSQDPNTEDPARVVLFAHYLSKGEIAFAWHLARLRPTPIPLPILRSLAVLPAIQQAEDMADPRRSSALAELAAALPDAVDPVAAGRLALAALLRPALFDPDHGARGHLKNLLGHPGLETRTLIIDVLAELGYDVRLSTRLLAELAGKRQPPSAPGARQRLADWMAEARHRRTVHQPTYAIFHRELQPEGEIGRVVEAILANAEDAEDLAHDLVGRLAHDRNAQEIFVSEAERRGGRPKRDRIEGMALDWFCRGVQEACDHVSDWLEAQRKDAPQTQDHIRERLVRLLGPIRKALEASVSASAEGDNELANAADIVLNSKLDDLRSLIEGQATVSATPRLRSLLENPLLRLPGGCQDWSDEGDPAFDDERAARDRRLAAALARPDCIAPDNAHAFYARLKETAILAAQHLLHQLNEGGISAEEYRIRRQQLDEEIEAARRRTRERVARLRQSLTTIGYLDLDAATMLPGDLAKLALIDSALVAQAKGDDLLLPALNGVRQPEVPPDFTELDDILVEMEARRDQLRTKIAARQRFELERLTSTSQGDSARALLDIFDRLDPVTADDAIAEIKAGRAVPMPEVEAPDAFTRFLHNFVAEIVAAPEETRRGRVLTALGARTAAGPLNMGGLDDRRASRLKKLLEAWGEAENTMQRSQPAGLRDALVKLFGLIGFTGVRLADGREALPGRLRLLTMTCDVPRRLDGFLPPAFGSAAGGRYQLLAARADVPLDQLLRQIGSEAPDAPWIVVLFGRLDVKDRSRLARQMRAEARSALVLDETLLLFAGLENDDPFASFLDCALPFAWVQPYTISPGQIPPEVFFGREAEINQIVSREGSGCLIYGGRQLGKSVLLNHVRGERHRPDRGELALYLDIRSIGGAGVPSDGIWRSLAHDLGRLTHFEKISHEPKDLVAAIETWLQRDPARRLLAMFDEADNFLQAEHASGYPNLLPLKGLMERTGRRFKAVFAGLHNVRRMARAPNSPLPHLGTPICIGPMNQSPENRAALRRLAVEPMHAAGLRYADPGLVSDMLARMNYYPSLVQVFGRQIVESFGRRPRAGSEGPRWQLSREELFEGAAAERVADQIRERFQLTLNLDVRYDCIARSIALHRLESSGGDNQVLAQGLTAAEIRRFTHWPRALAQPAEADFRELLEELVDLGILSRFAENRYGLRNAQVAQMLGGREELEEALLRLDEREDDPAYDAALFFRSLRPKILAGRAPLSDRDLDRLFDWQVPGLRMVRSCPEVTGGDVASRILAAAQLWMPGGNHILTKGDNAQLRRALDKIKATPAVLVIEGDWSPSSAEQLARQPQVSQGKVVPIWSTLYSAAQFEGALVFDTGAWSEAMLRHWLADEGLVPALDDTRTRAAIMAATGGAPARLEALRRMLPDLAARPVANRIEDLVEWAKKTPFSAESMGLDQSDLVCLKTLRDLEGENPSKDDLVAFCPEATESRLERLAALGTLRQGRTPVAAPILTPLGRLIAA